MKQTVKNSANLIKSLPRKGAAVLIRGYRWLISPLFGPCCRYRPTCSHYALAALRRHGFIKGLFLTAARILRCHPYSKRAQNDPVPEEFAWADLIGYKRKTASGKKGAP